MIVHADEGKIDFMTKTETSSNGKTNKPNITSIIIVTCNELRYLELCLENICRFTPIDTYELIIVDDHSTDGTVEWLNRQPGVQLLLNESDTGFSKCCNQGINASSGKYVLLLDARTVVTDSWLFNLTTCIESKSEIAAVGPATNLASSGQIVPAAYQNIDELFAFANDFNKTCKEKWEYRLVLSGFCILAKKEALLKIGAMDEKFSSRYIADKDLSMRLLSAGYKLILCGDTFVHFIDYETSETNNTEKAAQNQENLAKFSQKWGFSSSYSMSSRKEIVSLIKSEKDAAINILDVGCSCGGTLAALYNQYPKASLYGIELNQNAAKIAGLFANVQSCNCENEDLGYNDGFFDYIICADVLEHLGDPWSMLKKFHKLLKPSGFLLASIPNVMHHSVIRDLINGQWNYTDAGLLDRTHLRFFTPSTIFDMFVKAGFADMTTSSVVTVMSEEEKGYINKLCLLTDGAMRPNYEAYQIIVKAAVTKETSPSPPYAPPKSDAYVRTQDGLLIREKCSETASPIYDRALLIYDLHEDLDRNRNLSVLKGLLVDPLKRSGIFKEITCLYREAMFENGVEKWTDELLNECKKNKPELVVFHIPFCYHEQVAAALRYIRDDLNIPVLGFTTDLTTLLGGAYTRFKKYYDSYIACMTKTLSIDTSNPSSNYSGEFIIGFAIADYQLFNPSLYKKDIDVSFTGSIAQWTTIGNTSRKDYLEYLKPKLEKFGISYSFTDSSGRAMPIEDYAKIANRSKMIINFSQTTDGNRHMKGRVFEVLGSGALLLEEKGPDTCRFLDPGKDYIEFGDPEDLFNKICYFVNNSIERKKIASCGHRKAIKVYNEDNLIRYILDELGIDTKFKNESSAYRSYVNQIKKIKGES